jgi:hypothetical protein
VLLNIRADFPCFGLKIVEYSRYLPPMVHVGITDGSTTDPLYAYMISALTHQLMDLGLLYAYSVPALAERSFFDG